MQSATNDIIQWDVANWSNALSFWESKVDWSNVEHCLELGGRQGGLSLWLALKGKYVICSDLENVKESAEPLHIKHNIGHFIQYQDIDASNIAYENKFDVIVFKSIIGGIAKSGGLDIQQKVFDEIYKALKPGGKLLFAENLIASPLHQFARKKFNKWGDYWRYLTMDETQQFLSKFSKVELETTGFAAAFGRNEKQRNFLSKLDKSFFKFIIPNKWKYVIYGIATK